MTRLAAYGAIAFLGLAAAILGLVAVTNGQTTRGTGVYGEYSSRFAEWLYRTNEVAIDAANLRFSAENGGHEVTGGQLAFLARRQDIVNRQLRDAEAPAEWREQHARILAGLEGFDVLAADLVSEGSADLLGAAITMDVELANLLDRVITCYAKSPACS